MEGEDDVEVDLGQGDFSLQAERVHSAVIATAIEVCLGLSDGAQVLLDVAVGLQALRGLLVREEVACGDEQDEDLLLYGVDLLTLILLSVEQET